MEFFEEELELLVIKGKTQGYLTFDDINEILPDDEFEPEKVDELLVQLEGKGIKVVDERPAKPDNVKPASTAARFAQTPGPPQPGSARTGGRARRARSYTQEVGHAPG